MAANKQQLQTISLTLEDKDKAIDTLKDQVKLLEKQLAGNLKKILLQSEATVIENGETQVHDLLFFSSLSLSLSLFLSLSDFPPVNEHFVSFWHAQAHDSCICLSVIVTSCVLAVAVKVSLFW